jgi:hypothetical protein
MSSLMQLLKTIEANKFVETYRYLPDVVLSGGIFLEKDAVDQLLAEGYLQEIKQDAFGQFLGLSCRAKAVLQQTNQPCMA